MTEDQIKRSPVPGWPTTYLAKFRPSRGMSYRVATVLTILALTRTPIRVVCTIGVLVATGALGALVGVALDLPGGWLLHIGAALLVVIGGTASASFTNAQINERYADGVEARIAVVDGYFAVKLNGHSYGGLTSDVIRVRRFGKLSAIQFRNSRSVIVPSHLVPHYTR